MDFAEAIVPLREASTQVDVGEIEIGDLLREYQNMWRRLCDQTIGDCVKQGQYGVSVWECEAPEDTGESLSQFEYDTKAFAFARTSEHINDKEQARRCLNIELLRFDETFLRSPK